MRFSLSLALHLPAAQTIAPWLALRCALLMLLCAVIALPAAAQGSPTLTISPESGPVESAIFTILIEGLQPQSAYSLEFVYAGAVVFSSEERSDEQGRISFPAGSSKGDLPGTYTVRLMQAGAALASATFELTAPASGDEISDGITDATSEMPGEVRVSPPAAPIGAMHRLAISGLDADKRYTVEITATETQRVAYRRTRRSDRGGNIEIDVITEAGDALGEQAVAVYDLAGDIVATGAFHIDAPSEREVVVTVSPDSIAAGDRVTIAVSGLAKFAAASAQVKSAQGVLIDSVMARAADDGSANLSFASGADLNAGQYTVDIFAEGEAVAAATLTIGAAADTAGALEAAVAIEPPSGVIGSQHLIAASGLQPGRDYRLIILDPAGGEEYATMRAADAAGAFELRVESTPEDDIGIYKVEIRAVDADELLASATFEITQESTQAAMEAARQAIATIDPQSAVIGSSHVILLRNLSPGEQVNFDVTFAGDAVYSSQKTADAGGVIRLELFTETGDAPGDYLITARRASGNQPTVVLTATAPEAPAPASNAPQAPVDIFEGSLVDGRAELSFAGQPGQYTRITVRSDDFDPALALFDGDGEQVAMNDDSRARKSAVIGPLRLPSGGEYALQIYPSPQREATAASEGDFAVSIEAVRVAPIAEADVMPFTLDAAQPTAYFELPVRSGDSLALAVDSGGSLDSTLQVLAVNGSEVAFDDDSGPGFEAEISHLIVEGDDRYVLAVAAFDEGATGSGNLIIRRKPARQLDAGELIVTLSDKAIRDLVSFGAQAAEELTLHLRKLAGEVEDLFVTATVDGMPVMSYSAMGLPERLPLSFVMPMSGQVLVSLEKVGTDDGISLAISLERS